MIQPLISVWNAQYDCHDLDTEGDEMEGYLHNHDVGDVEANSTEEEMDHDFPYTQAYAWDSEDEGTDAEIDEDQLTAKESKAFKR